MTDRPASDRELYLPLSRIGKRYGLSRWTLLGYIKAGKLAAYKFGDTPQAHLRVKVSDLEALLVRVHPATADDQAGDPVAAADEVVSNCISGCRSPDATTDIRQDRLAPESTESGPKQVGR